MTDIIPFPLYHGTSTLFLSSIQEHGLGGIDPVAELGGVACLEKLASLADRYLQADDWWIIDSDTIKRMCRQSVSEAGFNFRHGDTYLSPAEYVAVRHALFNRYGSELLSYCIDLREYLHPHCPDELAAIEAEFSALFEITQQTYEPLLVRVDNMASDIIRTEQNEDPVERIQHVQKVLDEDGSDVDVQQCNFQLLSPPDAKCVSFFQIHHLGGPWQNFTYELTSLVPTDEAETLTVPGWLLEMLQDNAAADDDAITKLNVAVMTHAMGPGRAAVEQAMAEAGLNPELLDAAVTSMLAVLQGTGEAELVSEVAAGASDEDLSTLSRIVAETYFKSILGAGFGGIRP